MNNESFHIIEFIYGIVIGIIIVCVLMTASNDSIYNQANTAKEKCERTLPRNKICKIIAIPDETLN